MVRSRRRGKGGIDSYQTKKGTRWRWRIYVPENPSDPDSPETRLTRAGYRTADDADTAMREELSKQRTKTGQVPTLAEYATEWLHSQEADDDLAAATIAGYRRNVNNHIIKHLGDKHLDQLTTKHITNFYAKLRKTGSVRHPGEPLSANSVLKISVNLTSILDMAVTENWIRTNPAKEARKPSTRAVRKAAPEVEYWNGKQLGIFLEWDSKTLKDDMYLLWRVIALSGMRRSEAIALRWRDINATTEKIHVRHAADTAVKGATKLPKTDKPRVVDMDPETILLLGEWQKLRKTIAVKYAAGNSLVFGDHATNELRSPTAVTNLWTRRVGKFIEAHPDLPRVTLKGLRHSCGSILLESGAPLKVVQERLGHSSIKITSDIYSHVSETLQAASMAGFMAAIKTS